MFPRIIKPSKSHSFFLFGPRGTGKSTFLKSHYLTKKSIYIDLLEDATETRYSRNPDLLIDDLRAKKNIDWVIIDEIQKIPKLLDIVHKLMEEDKLNFILTGSSARKLKRGAANLLAGRAFLYHLHPFTISELGKQANLSEVLQWGSLPKIFSLKNTQEKKDYLFSYTKTYLKEEVLQEQIIRNIDGFRDFLEIAAQMNGKTLNFSKIARDCGLDTKTVQSYYQILEDTLMGFWLPGFHRSVRKAQKFQPKFFIFDIGVVKAIEGSLDNTPTPGTSSYGLLFEQFLITEIFRMNSYSQKDFKLSHYNSSTGQEIDLILSKGKKTIVIEIKSSAQIDPVEVRAFSRIANAFDGAKKYYVSQDTISSQIENVRCLHWKDFLKEIF